MTLNLTAFSILDRDCQRAKFIFELENYSSTKHKKSCAFQFAGHTWKLQTTKKDGHLGMFLRWYGTTWEAVNLKCSVAMKFSVLNKYLPDESVSQGTRKDKDLFERIGSGIGYGRIISLEELETYPGYLINDTLYLQTYLKVIFTSFQDTLSCVRQPGADFVKGKIFTFHSSDWHVILFPDGENPDGNAPETASAHVTPYSSKKGSPASVKSDKVKQLEEKEISKDELKEKETDNENEEEGNDEDGKKKDENMVDEEHREVDENTNKQENEVACKSNDEGDENSEADQSRPMVSGSESDGTEEFHPREKQACIYMMRDEIVDGLRHDAKFMISASGGNVVALEQHFYGTNCNVYGTATFMPVSDLKETSDNDEFTVNTKFMHVIPYVYFAYKIDNTNGYRFQDQNMFSWKFEFVDQEKPKDLLKAVLILDDEKKDKKVKLFAAQKKLLMVSWFVEILCLEDIELSTSFITLGRRELTESVFQGSGDRHIALFPITMEEISDEDSPYLDSEGHLSVKLAILCANYVEDITPIDVSPIDVTPVHETAIVPQKVEQVETAINLTAEDNAMQNDEEEDPEKLALIRSINDHIDAYETYIKDLNEDRAKAVATHEETSITELKRKSRPSTNDYENLSLLARDVESVIRTLPLNISKILYAGALGQTTMVANHYQLDFILFLKDYDEYVNSFKVVLNVIRERIKENCETDSSVPPTLPIASKFYRTSKGLLFKLGDVNVTLLLSRTVDAFGGFEDMYRRASKVDSVRIYVYNVLASERQIEFVRKQSEQCKDLICIVKAWTNNIEWVNVASRPSSYLVTLLLIKAYENVQKLTVVSKTPSFEKEVLREFGELILNEDLNVEWDNFYNPTDHPTNSNIMFGYPVIRDPAIPYHNVCYTGIKDWEQLRDESKEWISRLTY